MGKRRECVGWSERCYVRGKIRGAWAFMILRIIQRLDFVVANILQAKYLKVNFL